MLQLCALDHSYYLKQEVLSGLFLFKCMEILLPVAVNWGFAILNLGSLLATPDRDVVFTMVFDSKVALINSIFTF